MDTEAVVMSLLDWYALHQRPLPWRQEPTPYRVWISEIMLQQTRIEAVIPYFRRFMDTLPTVSDLADVSQERLYKLWEGLGYYSRARNLQKAARILMEQYDGELPADYDLLLTLPGIGPYTAGAIASIAYDIPVPAVDGNVMRVLARLTADDTDVLSTGGKKRFTDLAWELVPETKAGRFNQALMELGERVCVPNGAPHCDECPLRRLCAAYATNRPAEFPVRVAKKARRIEHRVVAVVCVAGEDPRVLLHKRPDSGLLAGLWELPNCPAEATEELLPFDTGSFTDLGACKHIFSHVEWHMNGRLYHLANLPPLSQAFRLVTLQELQNEYALPTAFRYYAAQLPQLLTKEKKNYG